MITKGEVIMDVARAKCMVDWPYPKSIKEVGGFLGLIGYYRRFVSNYGIIAQLSLLCLRKFICVE